MNKFTKQCVAAVASLAMAGTLCVAGAVVAGSSAWATPSVVGGDDTTLAKGQIGVAVDSGTANYKTAPWNTGAPTSGSITIYKWKNETDKTGNQKKATPVAGAGFTLKKIKSIGGTELKLNEYTSWSTITKNVEKLNAGAISTTDETGKVKVAYDDTFTLGEGKTNKNGVVQFKDLPLGLYQVQETTVPSGYSAADGGKAFYMTLPAIEKVTTNNVGAVKTETKYNYAPFVDPKNTDQSGSVTKTQNLTHTVGAGDTIEYTIKAKLDKSKAAKNSPDFKEDDFQGYTIFDLAPSEYFDKYDSSVVAEVKVGETDLKATQDKTYYTVGAAEDVAAPADKSDVARKKIKIEFTADGRAKLAEEVNKDANVGKAVYVTVRFKFTLKDSATLKTDKVTNKASVIPSHVPGTNVPEIPADTPPSTDFATFKIKKVSSKDQTALGGAKFRLFAVQADATACTNAIKAGTTGEDLDKVCKNKSSVGFGEKTTATETKENVSTLGETEAYSVKRGTAFYVVETEAPAGYIRNPDVHSVTVEAAKTEYTLPVENVPGPGLEGGKSWLFNLPKTGAAGVIIFALAGVCLVCFGIFVFMRNRKKDEEQQAA
ncbi:putative surface protein [Gardnerella vaginalis 1500E]|uniref:Putative surface protein n=1 Tax=Gardnerella vaginalis 1500E TaxID=698957 RepID=I4LZI9_GARVA|nr:SpaH/EbpB family LPXTG-anchored major pilin [Gardnerella vaginalis]EIK82379.1 putative surface protein [Gardnerella vaginalis 1500E]